MPRKQKELINNLGSRAGVRRSAAPPPSSSDEPGMLELRAGIGRCSSPELLIDTSERPRCLLANKRMHHIAATAANKWDDLRPMHKQ